MYVPWGHNHPLRVGVHSYRYASTAHLQNCGHKMNPKAILTCEVYHFGKLEKVMDTTHVPGGSLSSVNPMCPQLPICVHKLFGTIEDIKWTLKQFRHISCIILGI